MNFPLLRFRSRLLWLVVAGLVFLPGARADLPGATNQVNGEMREATKHLGQWIWDNQTYDKQTCRFWRAFQIPEGVVVLQATLLLAVDNGFSLFLDGREIGRGSDWKTLNQYDLRPVLTSGWHVLAVEGFNDRLEAGVILSLRLQLSNQQLIDLRSDSSWYVVPEGDPGWTSQLVVRPGWHRAVVVGKLGKPPWVNWPYAILASPPVLPATVYFWQKVWFQFLLLVVSTLAVLASCWLLIQLLAQRKTQHVLHRERARIARDIHDDLGGQLTQIVLLGEVAQREHPENSPVRDQFRQLCGQARELSRAMDEVVWAVNSRRDTLRDFVTYVCKYAQFFLSSTPIRCRLDVELDLPELPFDLPVRRNLFLALKEALHNVAKHSGAGECFLRIHRQGADLLVVVEDDGGGFDPATADRQRNGLTNMAERLAEIHGTCRLASRPGGGCVVTCTVPLRRPQRPAWLRRGRRSGKNETAHPAS